MKTFTIAAIVTLLTSGAAFADGPIVLGKAQLNDVTAAGFVAFDTNVNKLVNINKAVNLNVQKQVLSQVQLSGTLATAEGSADAIGFVNNLAEVDTFAQVQPGGAFAFAESLAAGTDAIGN